MSWHRVTCNILKLLTADRPVWLDVCADNETVTVHESAGVNEFHRAMDIEQDSRQSGIPHVCKCYCLHYAPYLRTS